MVDVILYSELPIVEGPIQEYSKNIDSYFKYGYRLKTLVKIPH